MENVQRTTKNARKLLNNRAIFKFSGIQKESNKRLESRVYAVFSAALARMPPKGGNPNACHTIDIFKRELLNKVSKILCFTECG